LASCQNLQYGIQDAVQIFTEIFCKKPQNKVAVLLREAILSAVSPVCFGVGEMLIAVELESLIARTIRLPSSVLRHGSAV
jgi:hypothetical protein